MNCIALARGCPDLETFFAATNAQDSSWKDIHNLFVRYKGCDDGVYAEGYSEFVCKSLAKHWDRFENLVKLSEADREFKDFVLKHIDATADPDDIELLLSNAEESCPENAKGLCDEIVNSGRLALMEMEQIQRPSSHPKDSATH